MCSTNGLTLEMFTDWNIETFEEEFCEIFQNVTKLKTDKELSIAIMPAGNAGIDTLNQNCLSDNIQVKCFIDNNCSKQHTMLQGIPVLSLKEALVRFPNLYVIVATLSAEVKKKIISQLNQENTQHITSDTFIYSNIKKYKNVFNILSDNISRRVLINILNYRISNEIEHLIEVARPAKYMYFEPDIYAVNSNDTFVDCGAYNGDTLIELMKVTGNEIQGYYGFEPSSENFNKLKIIAGNKKNFNLFKKGLYKNESLLKFDTDRSTASCTLSDYGNTEVQTITLDSILRNAHVSMIKMDIEGAEMDALMGSKDTIKRTRPVLAISTYHKPSDIINIPIFISSIVLNYNYYLRHYYLYFDKDTVSHCETVLYATPQR
ncbi:FkbM family methyltransferase [Desulfopila sp. IMCC35008]|uniref:FkbM family methyltransferase n=1 Tax=Desulfopila sp. IMCC35008 TaxID=2653858 RepID=UPI0013D15D1D|nr:FkbM family methyltransferase [Desulfopila sp. IMCC35008]